ncbi:MAG: hypothetical protein OXG37_05360 [Actinomycetia bacterium]|nr:hypothetical protein [Actinomycetes bacterium]
MADKFESTNRESLHEFFDSSPPVSVSCAFREVPSTSGLYTIHIDAAEALPLGHVREVLKERGTTLLYLGKASNLERRLIRQDLKHELLSTFCRGIGAVLVYRPPRGSLQGKKNQNNYRFSGEDTGKIIVWIDLHVRICWAECDSDIIDAVERHLIKRFKPLLNTKQNLHPRRLLAELRKECREIACS